MQHLVAMNNRPAGGSISPVGSPVHSFSSSMSIGGKTDKDVAPFLKNLRKMLDEESDEILRWTPNGRAFEIHDMEQMMEHVLPKYFKHRKYTSFQRQLNYFHFRKWTKSKAVVCTFSNDYFLRDQPELAWRITRKKSLHHSHAAASPQPPARALEPKTRPSRAHSMPTPVISARSHVDSSSSPTAGQQPYWLKSESVMINVPRTGSLSLPFPSPTDQDMMLKEHDHASASLSSSRRHYFAYPLHHNHSQAHFQHQHQHHQPYGAVQSTPESLDWIDCLLPAVDRIEDEIYSYMYPAAPVTAVGASSSALLSAKSSSSPSFEFVSTAL